MATPAQRTNTWTLDEWYDQAVAGTQGTYVGARELFAWGGGANGALGLNSNSQVSSPTQIPGSWRSLGSQNSIGYNQGVVNTDGELFAWGKNDNGQLGQNEYNIAYSSPVQIPGTWSDNFKMGYLNSAMVKADGTLWVSGFGNDGNLGQNDRTYRSSPVQVPGTWSTTQGTLTTNYYGTGAIKADGTMWGWGANHNGQLGINNRTYYSSPMQIPGTNWSRLYGDFYTKFGIKTDGTMWGWGINVYGCLGLNDQGPGTRRSSPTQIPGTWSAVQSNEAKMTAAINTSGELFVWGSGTYGKLGLNSNSSRSSPTQIPGTTWSKVSASADNVTAIKTDGTMWGWGKSTGGQLANNWPGNGYNRSSPIQIPGTTWEDVTASYGAKHAIQLN